MTEPPRVDDRWSDGDAYESYIGRWSRKIASEFIPWLGVPDGVGWLDVGCGSGALTEAILALAAPSRLKGVDTSQSFIASIGERITDPRVGFEVSSAELLQDISSTFDAAVSGLVLNFVGSPERAVQEMARVVRPGGCVAAYVWDYGGRMDQQRYFWDAATALDPSASSLAEANRFSMCNEGGLAAWLAAGELKSIETRAIDADTIFRDFDDYWAPFLSRQGPAPAYVATLSEHEREALRERLRASLPVAGDGSIRLVARAWAGGGTV